LLRIYPPIAFRPARHPFTHIPMASFNSGEQAVRGQCHHHDAKDGPVDPSAERQHSDGYAIQGEAFDPP
jgi:hypothetical protein